MRICILMFCVLIIGCAKENPKYQLHCQNCGRVIYDGSFRIDRNGIPHPLGSINRCKSWDINCVSRDDPERDKWKGYWGYEAGRKDALEFYYEKTFDPKTHHPFYVEGYKKGYKEVIDVKGLSKED